MSIEAPKTGKWNTDRRKLVGILGGFAVASGLAVVCPWIAGAVVDFFKGSRSGESEDSIDDDSLFAVGRIFLTTETSGNEELSNI